MRHQKEIMPNNVLIVASFSTPISCPIVDGCVILGVCMGMRRRSTVLSAAAKFRGRPELS